MFIYFHYFQWKYQNKIYLIDQQIFATACYLSHFSYLHMGNGHKFSQFLLQGGLFITLSQVVKLCHNKD